jgi:hypothetical protein
MLPFESPIKKIALNYLENARGHFALLKPSMAWVWQLPGGQCASVAQTFLLLCRKDLL